MLSEDSGSETEVSGEEIVETENKDQDDDDDDDDEIDDMHLELIGSLSCVVCK